MKKIMLLFTGIFCLYGVQAQEINFEQTLGVDSAGGTSRHLSKDVALTLVNNDCEDAIAIVCGETVTGTTTGSTDSGANPSPDVFYTFTGSGMEEIIILSLCGGGTDYDSYLRVFDDGCALISEIAQNDDACDLQSEVMFTSDGTTSYTIMVEGYNENSGNYSLAISCLSLICDPPTALVVDNFMVGSVDISWTASAGGVNYNWEIQDVGVSSGTPGEIAMNTSPGAFDTATGAFVYGNMYTLYVQSVCESDQTSAFASIDFLYDFLGVDSAAFEGFTMFPNPATDFLNIESITNIDQVTVFNMLGQKVLAKNYNATNVRLDVLNLTFGTYIINVTIDGVDATFKFLKK
jgi:hypothetical protein